MAGGLTSQAFKAAAVTPNNGADLPGGNAKALYVGTGGDVVVTMVGGGDVTWKNVPSGGYVLAQVSRVKATNTTASDILALY